jgi:formate/nitrite transporter FocA (FNT family)
MSKVWNVVGIIGGGLAAAIVYSSLYEQKESYGREVDNFLTGLWVWFTNSGAWDLGIYVGPFILGAGFVAILMWLESKNRKQRAQTQAVAQAERADLLP